MELTRAAGEVPARKPAPLISTVVGERRRMEQPIAERISMVVSTSLTAGTLCRTQVSELRAQAKRMGRAAFFMPLIAMVPLRRYPP